MQFDIISNVCCTLNAVNSFLLDNMFPLMQSLKTNNKRGKLPQNCRSFLYTYIYIIFTDQCIAPRPLQVPILRHHICYHLLDYLKCRSKEL